MSDENVLLISPDRETGVLLERAAGSLTDMRFSVAAEWPAAQEFIRRNPACLVIAAESMIAAAPPDEIAQLIETYPMMSMALLVAEDTDERRVIQALRQGFFDCIQLPLSIETLQQLSRRAGERRRGLYGLARRILGPDAARLQSQVNSMAIIERLGRKVTSMLDLDTVLTSVVEAAVDLTEAEEGSLLLLDEATGELYMRASKNFQQDFVQTFRLPIRNSLIDQVLRSAKPLVISDDVPQKIKTAYLVHTLIYVPLVIQERVIGILEVDHRQARRNFTEDHVTLMSALADYAAIAIENARLYSRSEYERKKLENILRDIEDGVIMLDNDRRLTLMNRKACEAFGVSDQNLVGKRLREVVSHQELLETLHDADPERPSRVELSLKDGRVLNTQLTPLPGIGLVITMQDITHLKELDRIKSDFVNTVSHDLRSPLTAILGYIELMERVGPVTQQQREFIHRVQVSVQSITTLINDLLDLGRIEAGFDVRKEVVPFSAILHYTIDGMQPRSADRSQEMIVDVPDDLPKVLGNPIRLRQMLNNLVTNAIKYTPEGGRVNIFARAQGDQIILQVSDTGPGIPPSDQPYIFDKFYRASNAPYDTPGTGLGLAIVKSIVENHLGRIWVESQLGQGATFTVILPVYDKEL